MWKTIRQISIGIVLGVVVFILGLFSYFYFNKNEIVELLIKEVNKQINTRIDVSKVSMSFWDRFPSISVKFENVVVYNAKEFKSNESDTLLRARVVFCDLDLSTMISTKPQINTISVIDGQVCIERDKNGRGNYSVIETIGGNDKSFSTLIINNLELKDINVEYRDYQKNAFFFGHLPNLQIAGSVSKNDISLSAYVELDKSNLIPQQYRFFQSLIFDGRISYINGSIMEWLGTIKGDNQTAKTNGFYDLSNGQLLVKLDELVFDNIFINSMLKQQNYKDIHLLSGDVHITDFRYVYSSMIKQQLTASFFTNVSLGFDKNMIDLKSTGRINYNGKTAFIKLSKTAVDYEDTHVHFEGDFEWPQNRLVGFTSFSANLSQLSKFLKDTQITSLGGILDGQAEIKANFKSPQNLLSIISDGQLGFQHVKFIYGTYSFSDINGSLDLRPNIFTTPELSGIVNNTFLKFNGKVLDVNNYIENAKALTVDGVLYSKHLDLNSFVNQTTESQSKDIEIPDYLNLNLNFKIDSLIKRPFKAANVDLKIGTNGKRVDIEKLTFGMADGNLLLKGNMLQQKNNDWYTSISANLMDVDVSKTFKNMNNFGQVDITDKNLSGRLTANVSADFVLSPDFRVRTETIYLDSDIKINDGAIVNYQTLETLSDFVDVKELQHIKFKELKNNIKISNNMLTIPYMDIYSSAIDIGIKGTHTFTNEIDYQVSIGLIDVLFNKFKRRHKEINPLHKNKKTVVYVDVKGSTKKYDVSLSKVKRIKVESEEPIHRPIKKFEIEFDDI